MEIERQFLVESLPALPAEYENLRQGYVALEPEIRIRQLASAAAGIDTETGNIISKNKARHIFSRQVITVYISKYFYQDNIQFRSVSNGNREVYTEFLIC